MKRVFRVLLFLFILTPSKAQTKRALIVAIGNYPHWPKLSSINDVDFITRTLNKQGFKKENVTTVVNQNATHTGITNALNNLINDTHEGDIVVIHFSSHGEQIEDDNGDETDGLDETIVTYNAILPDENGHFKDFQKAQQEYFRDDEFGSLVDKLRNKLGKNGDVIVFMDLCHSGTGTRGNTIVRGDKPPGVSLTFNPQKYSLTDKGAFREVQNVRGDENAMATYVVFSAARAEEFDAEIINNDDNRHVPMGSLSYAISKAFENLEPGTTYQSLFSKIQVILDEKVQSQHAVLEGNGIDRQLFGGKSVSQKPYIEIDNINGKDIRIKAGLLSGLDTGARVAVYPAGTVDPAKAKPLAIGTVNEAHSYTADVSLDKSLPFKQIASGWVFVTRPVYNTKPISIRIVSNKEGDSSNRFSDSDIKNIKERLKEFPLIRFDGDTDLVIVKGTGNDSIKVASNGYLFTTVNNISSNVDKLKEVLQNYAQYKFLQGLEIKDPDIHIEVKLVPVLHGKADTTKISTKTVNGVYEYNEGDTMVLWVRNTGMRPFYFNVLDMQPDGIINPVLPQRSQRIYADDLKINGGSSYLFDRFNIYITRPYGNEIFKIFASEDKIDLEDIATSRGEPTRGNFTVLENLVKDSYSAARGAKTENISNANGVTYDLLFRINPKPGR